MATINSTKRSVLEALADGFGALAKAADDEPIFVLRAQDQFAPDVVEAWASKVEAAWAPHLSGSGTDPVDTARLKVKAARALAHQMRAWQALNGKKRPD